MVKLQQKSTLYLSLLRAHASTNLNGRESEGFNSGPKQSASRITTPQNYELLSDVVGISNVGLLGDTANTADCFNIWI